MWLVRYGLHLLFRGLLVTIWLCPYVVYFPFMRGREVGTIPLLGRVKPHRCSKVQVIQWAADLADGLGADMGVDLGGLAGTVP